MHDNIKRQITNVNNMVCSIVKDGVLKKTKGSFGPERVYSKAYPCMYLHEIEFGDYVSKQRGLQLCYIMN